MKLESMLVPFLTITVVFGASSGATVCDALGICAVESSLAYRDPATGQLKCPFGMHAVGAPTRSDDYLVATADIGETGPTSYQPGELMDIHIRVLNPMKKFLGILIYAVQNDGVLGIEGCSSPGCDGKSEVKVGTWEETDVFQASCGGKAMTHREASVKNYHHILRWRAPLEGSGDVIFRVLLKQGATNGGFFYWPMVDGDLMLLEGPSADLSFPGEKWVAGNVEETCTEICNGQMRYCDRSATLDGTLNDYNDVKSSLSCQIPLLSTCESSPPVRDSDGYCWFENRDACSSQTGETTNICDAKIQVPLGSERLCPCAQALPFSPIFEAEGDAGGSGASGGSIAVSVALVVGVMILCIGLSCAAIYYYSHRKENVAEIKHTNFDHEAQVPSAPRRQPGGFQGRKVPPPPPMPSLKKSKIASPRSQYLNAVWAADGARI